MTSEEKMRWHSAIIGAISDVLEINSAKTNHAPNRALIDKGLRRARMYWRYQLKKEIWKLANKRVYISGGKFKVNSRKKT